MADDSPEPTDAAALSTEIAVVGLAARFPGARTPSAFWSNLVRGVESIQRLSESALRAEGVDGETLSDPRYVRAAAPLDGMEEFDAAFFGFSPREASLMDPQHRQFLEVCWEALESAGHMPEVFGGRIGVFAGSGMNAYMPYNLFTNPELMRDVGLFLVRHTGNDKDFLTTRVSYCLDLRGPAVNVQTACSTSLVAIHTAVQSLLSGECDVALAGGVTIELPHRQGYVYEEGEILSPDGHCRAFDRRSQGTVFGSGAGVVVLRRLRDAIDARDTIHAIVKATAVNNDGARKVGYLAPSVDGQAECIAEAVQLAGLTARDISYVECHGTGTPVGDPIEIAALTQAFQATTSETGFCGIGSVKTNIGHLDTAAGIASFIKVVEMMRHQTLAPTLHYREPNPAIDFPSTPFSVVDQARPWLSDHGPRRAGVSSLGVGGTNAHVILEEAPTLAPGVARKPAYLLALSARTADALDRATAQLADHLDASPALSIADVSHTLLTGRRRFAHRRVIAATTLDEAAQLLRVRESAQVITNLDDARDRPVIFMLPGGGAQHPNMFRDVYAHERVFREAMDASLAYLQTHEGIDLRPLLFPADGDIAQAAATLERPSLGLPAIAAVEMALGSLLQSFGIKPVALIGHSLGENVAAHLAGVLSGESLLQLVALRGRLFEAVDEGGMLSVAMTEDRLRERAESFDVGIAAINADESIVLSGPLARIEALAASLTRDGVEHSRLRIRTAAHSAMLEPILPQFGELLSRLRLGAPTIDCISNVSGDWLRAEDAQDASYWVRHLRSTVRFRDGLHTALQRYPEAVLLEVGPGHALSSFARPHRSRKPHQAVIPLARHHAESGSDALSLTRALGRLWASSGSADWTATFAGDTVRRIPLPTYPFQRDRHWVEPGQGFFRHRTQTNAITREADSSRWFFAPTFEPRDVDERRDPRDEVWLVLEGDTHQDSAIANAVVEQATHRGVRVVRAGVGTQPPVQPATRASVRAGEATDVDALLQRILVEHARLDCVIDLCATSDVEPRLEPMAHFDALHALCAVLGNEGLARPVRLLVVTDGVCAVDGEPVRDPARAVLLGPVRVGPKEYPDLAASLLDLRREATTATALAAAVVDEVCAPVSHAVVATRGARRYVEQFTRLAIAAADAPPEFPRDGATLITGGLGGLGLTFAQSLAESGVRAFVLTGRQALPPQDRWLELIASRAPQDGLRQRLEGVLALQATGAEVLVVAADVTSLDAMREVWRQARERFGAVRAVVHAAGLVDDAPLAAKDRDAARRVIAPKLLGAQVLLQITEDEPLDLLVFFSSSSTVLAPIGQVDYVGANAALDALAVSAAQQRPATRVLSLAWGVWRDVGMASAMFDVRRQLPSGTETNHPLLGVRNDANDAIRFVALLSPESTPVLDEHRIRANGQAVLPGTAFVEMARAAIAESTPADERTNAIELRDLFFTTPLLVRDGGVRRLSVSCHADGSDGTRVVVSSSADRGGAPVVHARGVGRRMQHVAATIDVAAAFARCTSRVVQFEAGTQALPQDRHLTFGAGWRCLRSMHFGENEAIATLSAPSVRTGDDAIGLPPGVLDMASGFAFSMLDDGSSDDIIVPLGYERIVVHGTLPQECVAYVAKRRSEQSGVAALDVTICTPAGQVLVAISNYLLSRVSAASLTRAGGEDAGGASAELSLTARTIEHGITPADGFVALRRALAAGREARVLVSSIDLFRLLAESQPADRSTRVASTPAASATAMDASGPRDEVERTLCDLWRALLGVERLSIHDNFFELGGHSLIAVRLFARIKKRYGVELSLSLLFEAPTIEQCASVLRRELGLTLTVDAGPTSADPEVADPARWSPLVRIAVGDGGIPFFCVHGAGGNVLNFRELARQIGDTIPFYGLQAQGVDGRLPPLTDVGEMAALYLPYVLRTQPQGPFVLGGYSGGGVVAIELARLLLAQGHEVPRVILLDTFRPGIGESHPPLRVRLARMLSGGPNGAGARLRQTTGRRLTELSAGLKLRYYSRQGQPMPFDLRDLQLTRSFNEAAERYQPAAYDGPVTLFRASEVAEIYQHAGPKLGWDPYLPRLTVHEVPGGHDSMVREPNVQVLCAILRDELTTARRTRSRA